MRKRVQGDFYANMLILHALIYRPKSWETFMAWFVQSASGQLILRENESMPGRGIRYRGGAHPENAERPRPSRMAGRNATVLS